MNMCSHRYSFEGQGSAVSKGICVACGDVTYGANGFPDNAYNHGNTFSVASNPLRQPDNNIERILNDKRYAHIYQRNYIDKNEKE
jgi:hypothetical protein